MWTALSSELLAVLAAGALCGVWVLFQLWIARVDPENQGVRGSCGACSGGVCQGGCEDGARDENVLAGRFGEGER